MGLAFALVDDVLFDGWSILASISRVSCLLKAASSPETISSAACRGDCGSAVLGCWALVNPASRHTAAITKLAILRTTPTLIDGIGKASSTPEEYARETSRRKETLGHGSMRDRLGIGPEPEPPESCALPLSDTRNTPNSA